MSSSRHWSLRLLAIGMALATAWSMTGCRTSSALPPVDLESGGWRLQEVPVVWRPRRGAPELTGELLVAAATNGSRLVQFSKQGLPLVTAQVHSNRWQISSSLRAGIHAGRMPPPRAVLWLLVDGLPPSAPRGRSRGWRLIPERPAAGWLLTNSATGEALEGFSASP